MTGAQTKPPALRKYFAYTLQVTAPTFLSSACMRAVCTAEDSLFSICAAVGRFWELRCCSPAFLPWLSMSWDNIAFFEIKSYIFILWVCQTILAVKSEAYMICPFFDNLPVIDNIDVIGLVKYVESMCHQNPRAMSQGSLKYTVFKYPRSNMSVNSGERIVE